MKDSARYAKIVEWCLVELLRKALLRNVPIAAFGLSLNPIWRFR